MESLAELSSSLPKSKGAAEAMSNGAHARQRHRGRPHNIAAWVDSLSDASRRPRITTATATTTRNHRQEQCLGSLQPITRFCRQQDSSRMPYAQPTRSFIAVVQHLLQEAGASPTQREQLFWDAYTWLAEYFGQPYPPLRHPPNNCLARLSPSPLTQLALYDTTAWNRYQQDFEEEGVLGHGGFGCVVRARRKLDNCRYAIKIIPIMDEVESPLQEVQALIELDNPRLVRYYYSWIQPYHNIQTRAIVGESNSGMGAVTETSSETGGTDSGVSPCLASASQRECTPSDESVVFQESEAGGREAHSHIPNNQSLGKHSDSRHTISQSQGSEKSADRALLPYRPQAVFCPKFLFIQMGLCGESLQKWLDRRNKSGSPVEGRSLEIFREIVEGLCYMHRSGYIHRDVKPANIFFTLDGLHIQVGDFGLAKLNPFSPAVLSTALRSGLTPTMQQQQNTCCVGTPLYAAPEVQMGNYGPKSDIYSMGIILLELFSVFSTSHQKLDVIKNLKDNRLIDRELNNRWPHIAYWILRLTEPEPASRPSSDELLKSSLFPQPLPPPPPSLITSNTTALSVPRPVCTSRLNVLQEPGGTKIIQSNFNDNEVLKLGKNKTEDSITVCTVEQCQSKDEENALLKEESSTLEGAVWAGNTTKSECNSVEILKVNQNKTQNSFTALTTEKCMSKDEENAVLKEEINKLKRQVEELQLKVRLQGCSFALQETEK